MDLNTAMNANQLTMTPAALEQAVDLLDQQIPIQEAAIAYIEVEALPLAAALEGEAMDAATAAAAPVAKMLIADQGPQSGKFLFTVDVPQFGTGAWRHAPETLRHAALLDEARQIGADRTNLQARLADLTRFNGALHSRRHVLRETLELKRRDRAALQSVMPVRPKGSPVDRLRAKLGGTAAD